MQKSKEEFSWRFALFRIESTKALSPQGLQDGLATKIAGADA